MKVGQLDAKYFDGQGNIGRGTGKPSTSPDTVDPPLAELLDLMMLHRVPGNIESAEFTAAANDTWEDYDLVAALNTALATAGAPAIRTGEAVRLLGTLEVVNGNASANTVLYGHGGTPDDDDTRRTHTTPTSAGSEYLYDTELLTDSDGNIKIETDDVSNLGLVFHLEAYQYVRVADSSVAAS